MISYFDAHCDTIYACSTTGGSLRQNSGHIDLVRGGQMSRYAQFFALFHDGAKAPAGGMWAQCNRLHELFLRQMEENRDMVRQCRTGRQVDETVAQGKVAALLSIEAADLLECRIEHIETVQRWGVRFMNLTWNHATAISGTNVEDTWRGLSPLGRDFARQLERCGIYPDVSHLSDAGFWDVIKQSRGPVVASHSNARALCNHPRNLTDDQFCAIRDSGGVVGLNFYLHFVGQPSMDALVAHVEHFLALHGEKTLCLGGDLDGCDVLAGGLRGLEDVPLLYTALALRGYDRALLEDLFWNNLRTLL